MAKKTGDDADKLEEAEVKAALERVLDHAESHGEVYDGASDDHALLREFVASLE